jgi:ketosteroid isomerase-like protein
MSQQNLDLVRHTVQTFNDRDMTALESICSEDLVYRLIGGFSELIGTELRGRDAVLGSMNEWLAALDSQLEIEMIRDVNDQVVVVIDVAGVGAASGASATLRIGQVYSFRDGRVSLVDSYYNADEALKAVGLAE